MERLEWDKSFETLKLNLEFVSAWEPDHPNPLAQRCERSRHRTLAHLRSCQEQWMVIVKAFLERDNPNVTILHPWRLFDQGAYQVLSWEDHFTKWEADRREWLAWQDLADWERGGKWNRKPDTIGGLTDRLARHESYHLDYFR